MVREIRSPSELNEYLSNNRIVLIAITKRGSSIENYVKRLMEKFEERAGHVISFAFAYVDDIANALDSKSITHAEKKVLIRLYVDGEIELEQYDLFEQLSLDLEVLRRSVKNILRKHSIKTLF